MTSLAEKWTEQMQARQQDEGDPAWLNDLRGSGAAALRKYGLPHRKTEDWKYTSLKLLEARSHGLAVDKRDLPDRDGRAWPEPLIEGDVAVIRLLNGRPEAEFNEPAGIRVQRLEDALGSDIDVTWLKEALESLETEGPARAFQALNTSMLGPGLVIHVPANTEGGTLMLQWAFDEAPPAMLFSSRVVIRLEAGASLNLVEQFESGAEHTHGLNLVVQAHIGRGARLRQVQVQQEKNEAVLITHTESSLSENARHESSSFDWGGGLVRHDTQVELQGSGAAADVRGAFVLNDSLHLDHHVFIDHVGGGTSSEQFFRGVLGGKSRGVFNGKARICQGADGSSVRQSNANLLLSPLAEIDTKPELEIYADEVEASHGATVGQLDEEAVFYLRSRGLSEEAARGLLTAAFCKAVLDRATNLPASLSDEIASRMECFLGVLVGSRSSLRETGMT